MASRHALTRAADFGVRGRRFKSVSLTELRSVPQVRAGSMSRVGLTDPKDENVF